MIAASAQTAVSACFNGFGVKMTYSNKILIYHLATDGLAPILRHKVDDFNEEEFKIWCDYHYSICREKSILGASSHGLIIGSK